VLEDANAVQVALMKVIQMLGSGRMDHKTAGLILYALQTASVNLRNAEFEVDEVTDVVIDRDTVDATSINGPQWFEEDFAGEVEDDDEVEYDADGEDTRGGVQVQAESGAKKAARSEVKQVNIEEARVKVKGVIRDWLLETVGENAEVRPG